MLRACQARHCEDPCGLTCGGLAGSSDSCQPCAENCCADERRCNQNAACHRLRLCRAACPRSEPGCRERCVQDHPTGASLERALADCQSRSCDVTSDLSCVGSVGWPTAPGDRLSATLVTGDVITLSDIPNITVDICDHADPSCATPTGTYVTNLSGRATIELRLSGPSYSGFFAVLRESTWAPSLHYFFPPVATDGRKLNVGLVSNDSVNAIFDNAGLVRDTARGHVLVEIADCAGWPASDLTLRSSTADADSQVFYLDGTVIAPEARSTLISGRAGILNLAPGTARLVVEHAGTCQRIGEVDVLIRPATFTNRRTHADTRSPTMPCCSVFPVGYGAA